MGCDIHFFTEKRVGSTWVSADTWEPDEYDDDGRLCAKELYEGRSYILFSVLADVRNYHGIKPISEARGLPADVSPEVRDESEHWGSDGHSHSWLTLAEILACDWKDTVTGHTLSDYMGEAIEAAKKIGKPEDVRFVFWFDN